MKKELRQSMRAKRRALSPTEQTSAARALLSQLACTSLLRTSRRIACYLANDGEIDPWFVMDRLWSTGKQVYLPVLSRTAHDRLWFAAVTPDTRYRPNRFGIPEPIANETTLVRAQGLDLIFVPLVAFDAGGNRLGMGGGFYDKSLAFLQHRRHWYKPRLFGLAHDFQRVSALPTDAWDIPLDGIVTDAGVYFTARNA